VPKPSGSPPPKQGMAEFSAEVIASAITLLVIFAFLAIAVTAHRRCR
jgi:hypothetical protein